MPPENMRSVLITGASQGIGYHTAYQLCSKGYHITMICRDYEKARKATNDIVLALGGSASVDFIIADLRQLKSVSKCAHELIARKRRFTVIILNAGVLLPNEKTTEDGFDTTFQVNHLSHFYLINELLGSVIPKEQAKIITLTSILYKLPCFLISSSKDEKKWKEYFSPTNAPSSGWKSYARSKLAATMMACHLDNLDGIEAIAVHPGAVHTSLSTNISPKIRYVLGILKINKILCSVDQAAQNVVEAVEATHQHGTIRNGTKYSRISKKIMNIQNTTMLMNICKSMIASVINDLEPNKIIFDEY